MFASAADAASRRWTRPSWFLLATIAALVFVSAYAGLAIYYVIGRVGAIWVANAVLVYFLLSRPRTEWAAILATGLGANFAADMVSVDSLATALTLTLSNAIGILIVAIPFERLGLHGDLSRPKPLCLFYALALGPAPLASGLVSAFISHQVNGGPFLARMLDWYATDALGYSIVVPLLMTVRLDALKAMFARDQIAVTLLLLGVFAGTLGLIFVYQRYPIAFLIFPAVILMTFQRGIAGGSIALLMAAAYLIVPVLTGQSRGALHGHTLREQIILVQVFVAVTGFSVVLVGAALAERRRLEQGLAASIVRAENLREEAIVARDAAERANRLKSMFLATMSHELRTPLNAIIGFSDLMHGEPYGSLGDPRYREYSSLIQSAGHHLLSLINDILDMSKIEAGRFELNRQPVDVREIVGDCIDLVRDGAVRAGVALTSDIQPTPLVIPADRRAMKQILLNLLSNAIKFTPSGGRVVVHAGSCQGDLVLSVQDTGIGIAADQVGLLGNPFVQIRSSAGASHKGTGLGLALVRALSDIHGGSLEIVSALGQGSTMTVILPGVVDQPMALPQPKLARTA